MNKLILTPSKVAELATLNATNPKASSQRLEAIPLGNGDYYLPAYLKADTVTWSWYAAFLNGLPESN